MTNHTLLLLLLLPLTITHSSVLDNYCGKDWVNAANACPLHCPSGDDDECTKALGPEFGCFLFTGCHERVEAGEFGNRDPVSNEEEEEEEEEEELPVEMTRYCGVDFIDAMLNCDEGKKCPGGDGECKGGEVCVENTNCDKPLVTLRSEIVFTFTGTTTPMETEDWDIFNQVIFDLLKGTTTDLNIHLESIKLLTQRTYEDTSTVEVDVMVQAKYRPPPEQKFSTIVENTINLQKDTVRANLKKVGTDAKRYYFTTEVDEIGAVSKENATNRPTLSPTGTPTLKPTNVPSMVPSPSPSAFPTASPSDVPSSMPSREHIQEIITATTNELKNMDDTSHGFLVNMRTTENSPVLLVNGLQFYTESTENVGFELWSKLGTFEGFEGTYDGWDMIATGMVKGAGYGRYTSIPTELFTPVSIPGGGGAKGTRAFYLTLNSKDLVIKLGKVQGNAGATDNRVMASSQDLEIYNGKAVLSYPFPNPAETWFYHSPRMFLGVVTYDRLPCKPFSLYGPVEELPCGNVALQTMKPTVKPTAQIKDEVVGEQEEEEGEVTMTNAPTIKPTPKVTDAGSILKTSSPTTSPPPTISAFPTASKSPTLNPTLSPVVPLRASIIVTLHNTPDILMNQEEQGIFIETLLQFLNDQSGKAMVIGSMDIESEELVLVTASPASAPTVSSTQVATNSSSTINTTSISKEVARNTFRQRLLQKVPGVRISLILTIASTTLPHNLLGNMAVVAIEENQRDLVDRFDRVGLDYAYFESIDGVTSLSISDDSADVQPEASSKVKVSAGSGGNSYVKSDDEESSVNIALLVSLFWCTLAVGSIILLTKARSKLRNDNIEKEKSDEANSDEQSDAALRTSILRLIPLGSEVESATQGSRRSLLTRSLRLSRRSLQSSMRSDSFRNDDSLRDNSDTGRSGLRSSMRQSLTMSEILGVSSDDDDAPLRSSATGLRASMRQSINRGSSHSMKDGDTALRSSTLRQSGTGMRSSLRRSVTRGKNDSLKDDDAPLRRSGTALRASMRQSITRMSAEDADAPLRSSAVGRGGAALRSSMRQSITRTSADSLQEDDAPLRRSTVGRSGTAMRSSIRRQSITQANAEGLEEDDAPLRSSAVGRGGAALRSSMRQSITRTSADSLQDEDAPPRRSTVGRSGTAMRSSMRRQSITKANVDSENDDEAKRGNSLNKAKTRNNLSKSVVFDDSVTSLMQSDRSGDEKLKKSNINVAAEDKTEEEEKKSTEKIPERSRRRPSRLSQSMTAKDTMSWGNSEEKKEDPVRQKADSIYKPQRQRRGSVNEGSLRDSKVRGNAENLATRRDERRALSQSMSGVKMSQPSTTRRQSDGDTTSMRRSNGTRGSSDNLRASTRRATVDNGGSNDDKKLRGSIKTSANDTNLRGSVRRSTNVSLRGSVRRSGNETNLRGSVRRSSNDANLRGSVRRSSNETNLRGSVRRSSNDANLRGSVRRSSEDANLRGSVRKSTNGENLRGSVRRSSDGNDSARDRTSEQQRRAGPRRREIV